MQSMAHLGIDHHSGLEAIVHVATNPVVIGCAIAVAVLVVSLKARKEHNE